MIGTALGPGPDNGKPMAPGDLMHKTNPTAADTAGETGRPRIASLERMRQALAASESRSRLMIRIAPLGMLVFDRAGLVLEANARAQDLLGLEEQPRGCYLFDLVHPDDLDPAPYTDLPPVFGHGPGYPPGMAVARTVRELVAGGGR